MARKKKTVLMIDLDDLREYAKRFYVGSGKCKSMLEDLALQEGLYVVKQAKSMATDEKMVKTGQYRRSFQVGEVLYEGKNPFVYAFNPLEYALYLEKGFRRHFVPGYWTGKGSRASFVYDPNAKGGATFGPYEGRWIMKRAAEQQKKTMAPRMNRKINKWLKEMLRKEKERS